MKLAVIPARGGSKRIPRKNIKLFAGKPIIAYSIEAALEAACFDRIIVSTDDEEIARVAESHGAEIPFVRPASLADDFIGTNPVVKHAVEWFLGRGARVEHVCCIYATAPFIQAGMINRGLEKLSHSGKSFAFSVTSYQYPVQRALRINADGFIEALYPENIYTRSQDLKETYHDAAQFYWGTSEAFLNEVSLFSSEAVPVTLPRFLVQDIDTEEDWIRAEFMFKALALASETGK